MYRIQNLTANAKQKQTLILPDGTKIFLAIEYCPAQLGWYITELTYKNFSLKGFRLTNGANILYQYRNQIPFGLACYSTQKREPTLKEDFLNRASELYIITATEVEQYTSFING